MTIIVQYVLQCRGHQHPGSDPAKGTVRPGCEWLFTLDGGNQIRTESKSDCLTVGQLAAKFSFKNFDSRQYLDVSTQCTSVTDRRTERQANCHSILYKRRSVNIIKEDRCPWARSENDLRCLSLAYLLFLERVTTNK